MRIYIVYGCTGEYSDHTEWTVKSFHSKEAAEDFVNKANEWCKENGLAYGYNPYKLQCPFDSQFKCYSGTKYYSDETELT